MANHKSSEKRIRQTVRRREVNRKRESKVKASVKKVELAIASGKKADAGKALVEAQSLLMRAVSAGVLKLPTASRKVSRLSQRIKKLAA
ncbi:MAG: 30S ribosomal protein S20 [Rickettsiales bacterium]|jgi:small subunit ribosomal protein S20|nr:30S ribosomal protein S20 [Rickettsiales bacterium]